MTRTAEQFANELIAAARGKYAGVEPLVRRFAQLSCEIEELHERIMAMPAGALGMAALVAKVAAACAESAEIFEMLTGPGHPLPEAMSSLAARRSVAKVQRYRERQRRGEAVMKITIPQFDVIEYLIATGRLTEVEALDRHQVEHAIADVVVDLVNRWNSVNR